MNIFLQIFIIVILSATSLFGQPSKLPERIAGAQKKEWIQFSWKESMGSGKNGCLSGVSYQFFSNKSLKIWECRDGNKVLTGIMHWAVKSDKADNYSISINDVDYLVLFTQPSSGNITKMRLRKIVPDKSQLAQVIDLSYEN